MRGAVRADTHNPAPRRCDHAACHVTQLWVKRASRMRYATASSTFSGSGVGADIRRNMHCSKSLAACMRAHSLVSMSLSELTSNVRYANASHPQLNQICIVQGSIKSRELNVKHCQGCFSTATQTPSSLWNTVSQAPFSFALPCFSLEAVRHASIWAWWPESRTFGTR